MGAELRRESRQHFCGIRAVPDMVGLGMDEAETPPILHVVLRPPNGMGRVWSSMRRSGHDRVLHGARTSDQPRSMLDRDLQRTRLAIVPCERVYSGAASDTLRTIRQVQRDRYARPGALRPASVMHT